MIETTVSQYHYWTRQHFDIVQVAIPTRNISNLKCYTVMFYLMYIHSSQVSPVVWSLIFYLWYIYLFCKWCTAQATHEHFSVCHHCYLSLVIFWWTFLYSPTLHQYRYRVYCRYSSEIVFRPSRSLQRVWTLNSSFYDNLQTNDI